MQLRFVWYNLLVVASIILWQVKGSKEKDEERIDQEARKALRDSAGHNTHWEAFTENVKRRYFKQKEGAVIDQTNGRILSYEEYYQLLKEEYTDKDWELKEDRREDNFPEQLKKKLQNGENITRSEEAKFENEYGHYKSRPETTIFDLVNIINRGK